MKQDDAVTIMHTMWKQADGVRKKNYILLGTMSLFTALYAVSLYYLYFNGFIITSLNYVAGIMCVLSSVVIFKNSIDARNNAEEVYNLYLEMNLKNETKKKRKTT